MLPTAERILGAVDDPRALEALYQQDPEAFRGAFAEAAQAAPGSVALGVWAARLEYSRPGILAARRPLGQAIGLGLAVGALVRLPALGLGEQWYYTRLAPTLVLLSLAAYFWLSNRDRRQLLGGLGLAVLVAGYTALLPGFTDSVVMALLHLPILAWAFLGVVFTGGAWRDREPRIRFLRYNGELLILASLVGLGGMVFSGLTIALFEMVTHSGERTAEWYMQNIGVIGAAAVPVAATYLYDVVFRRRTGIASVLAHVFAPLFLLMTSTYLVVAFVGGQNPFVDRDFLIILNGLLIVVLGMTVLSIAERGEDVTVGWTDHVNVALLVVTIVVGLIALAAIVFRLTSYGLTPNRVVVLGANLVVMTHLVLTCRSYIGFIRGRTAVAGVRRAVASYLPVYAGWAALVAFILPLVFRYG